MNILAKRNILFAHISPSVKMRSATALARLSEISAPLQKVDFQGIIFTNDGQHENPAVWGLAIYNPAALRSIRWHGSDYTQPPKGCA
jgi:hypothetical protein